MINLFALLIPGLSFSNSNTNNIIKPHFKFNFPPLVYDRSLLLMNKYCTYTIMINLGFNYVQPQKTIYENCITIDNDLQYEINKSSDFDYVINKTGTYFSTNDFSCNIPIEKFNFPFYIGEYGLNTITGFRIKDNNNMLLSNIKLMDDILISNNNNTNYYQEESNGVMFILFIFFGLFYLFHS
jgi:hypothetical protein